jgi:hypothetical protein
LHATLRDRFERDQHAASAHRVLSRRVSEAPTLSQQQRPYYSEGAITDVEAALTRIMGQLEQLCTKDNADQLVSSLLKKFDVVTNLSAWSDPKHSH